MPVTWQDASQGAPADTGAPSASAPAAADRPPLARAILRPHRSLTRPGFHWFLLLIWALLLVPAIPLLGTAALWMLLPFLIGALALVWLSIERSYRDGRLEEELTLWPDRIRVVRREPGGTTREWEANPYWVRLTLHPGDRPVRDYLTLKGGGREIELGAFLSPEERRTLKDRLDRELARARGWTPG